MAESEILRVENNGLLYWKGQTARPPVPCSQGLTFMFPDLLRMLISRFRLLMNADVQATIIPAHQRNI